jgi:hypothetical protein
LQTTPGLWKCRIQQTTTAPTAKDCAEAKTVKTEKNKDFLPRLTFTVPANKRAAEIMLINLPKIMKEHRISITGNEN